MNHFPNGVRISPIMGNVHALLAEDHLEPGDLSSLAFCEWLNASTSSVATNEPPPITNFAAWLYDRRVDLREAFPSLHGPMRIALIQWYLIHAQKEYDLDDAFVAPMQRAVLEWAVKSSPDDPLGDQAVPLVTNLGVYLHVTQPNLQKPYPDIFGRHRVDFAVWYLYNADLERCARRDLILPVVLSWARACSVKK